MSSHTSTVGRTHAFCALLLGLWSTAVAGQPSPSATLPDALRRHLQSEQYDIVTSIRGLPLGVRNELESMWRSQTLDIAEPGTEFQGTGENVNRTLPSRRLVAAGCARDHHCLVYYERGGRDHTWLMALFAWTPAASRLEVGGTAPAGLKTVDDVRKALLSGAIKDSNGSW